jgi:hypothetical protein
MPDSKQANSVIYVAFGCSLLSVAGALFIIANWVCNRAARRLFFLRLIVFLALANLLSALGYIMSFIEQRALGSDAGIPAPDDGPAQVWCLVQALLLLLFENASMLWTIAIALALHQQVVARRAAPEKLEPYYHLVGWGVPSLLFLALLFTKHIGPADEPRAAWCWIASNALDPPSTPNVTRPIPYIVSGGGDSRWVQLVAFYIPLLLAFAFNLVTYLRVGAAFRRLANEGAVDAAKERMIQLRLRLYLLVFLVVWAFPLAHRFAEFFSGERIDPLWLQICHTVCQCSMGFFNALVYGCNEATLKPYREVLTSLYSTCVELFPASTPSRRRRSSRLLADSDLTPLPFSGGSTGTALLDGICDGSAATDRGSSSAAVAAVGGAGALERGGSSSAGGHL